MDLKLFHNEIREEIEILESFLRLEERIEEKFPGAIVAAYELYEEYISNNYEGLHDTYQLSNSPMQADLFHSAFSFIVKNDRLEIHSWDNKKYLWSNKRWIEI